MEMAVSSDEETQTETLTNGCVLRKRVAFILSCILGVSMLAIFAIALLRLKSTLSIDVSEEAPESLPLLHTKKDAKNKGKVSRNSKENSEVTSKMCTTKGCVHAASKLMMNLDETVDPCEDFYSFSCGSFIKNTVIPDKKSTLSKFSIIQDELNSKLRLSLMKPAASSSPHYEKLLKDLYNECMDTSKIRDEGLSPLEDILETLGGWPVVKGAQWNESRFSWIRLNNISRQTGLPYSSLFDVGVHLDLSNSSSRTIWIDEAALGLSREYLVKGKEDPQVKAYLKYSTEVAMLLGADQTTAEKDMMDVLEFHIKLANISLSREGTRNFTKLNNKFTIANLTREIPEIPWLDYINMLMPFKMVITDGEVVSVSNTDYFKNFTRICMNTPNRTIANYMLWRIVQEMAPYLSEDIRDLQLTYLEKLSGKKTREPRWEECVKFVSRRVPFAVGRLYIQDYFDEDSKKKVVEMFDYIKQEFNNILHQLKWMDERTRSAAIFKASVMKTYIGYHSDLLSDNILDDYYKNVSLGGQRSNHLENALKVSKFDKDFEFKQLREVVNKSDWKLHGNAAVVNAYYSFLENAMKFPAGILQGFFFQKSSPHYLNYGAIGSVIGHEITHGFDDMGKQFDEVGNLINWWEPETQKEFDEKAKCIIWQYGNYTMPESELKLNGINTQGENIADNGGLKEAYYGYTQWTKNNGEELSLPGLDYYTAKQLFWVSFAQAHCGIYRPDALKLQVLTGYHSVGRFRVIGTLSNMKEFSKDWKCPLGSKMNPVNKCHVW